MMGLRLYSLGADFKAISEHEVENVSIATKIVQAHIAGSGYTNLRQADEDTDDCGFRFIADPPKGRKGRNVASLDF